MSPSILAALQYTEEELHDLVTMRRLVADPLPSRRELEEGGPLGEFQTSLMDKAGKRHPVVMDVSWTGFGEGHLCCRLHDLPGAKPGETSARGAASSVYLLDCLDYLSSHLAVLDDQGCIEFVNRSWKTFAKRNGVKAEQVSEGVNYLAVCQKAETNSHGVRAAEAIGELLAGNRSRFSMEYPCHSPNEKRWFTVIISRFTSQGQTKLLVVHDNITQRMTAELKLRESQERFYLAMRGTQDGLWDWNIETHSVYFSPRWKEMVGYRPDELDNSVDTWRRLMHPDDREAAERRLEAFFNGGGENYDSEFRLVHKAGHAVDIHARAFLIRDHVQGKPQRMVGTHSDVTERKQAEAKLKAALQSVKDIQAVMDRACFIMKLDPRGRITDVNGYVCRISGFSREELIGKQFNTFQRGDLPASLWEALRQRRIWRGEVYNESKDGTGCWVDTTIGPLCGAESGPKGFLAMGFDITEKKRDQEALKESKLFMEEVIDSIPLAVFIKDAQDLRFVVWNKTCEDLIGVSREEALGKTDFEVFPHKYAESHTLNDRLVLETDLQNVREERLYTPHNSERTVRTIKVSLKDGTGVPCFLLGVAEDITERKETEVELADLNKRLGEAYHEAGMAEVASSVLHNVGNVLNSVNVSVTVLEEKLAQNKLTPFVRTVGRLKAHENNLAAYLEQDSYGPRLIQYLESFGVYLENQKHLLQKELSGLRRNADHIQAVVAVQQDYATRGGIVETVAPEDLIEDTLQFNQEAVMRHKLTIIKEIDAVPPLTVEKHKILQILINLFRNAKYACDDSSCAEKRVILRVCKEGDFIRFTVEDNGVGIPPENTQRIFNHGFTTRKGGRGFGLHSAANTARELGGELTVHSDGFEKGAVFSLRIPLTKPQHMRDGRKTLSPVAAPSLNTLTL